MNIYDFEVEKINGEKIKLDTYKGKVVLIVNTASKCGFTPQFAALEELYKKYGSDSFVILGFPCNQFAGQDPGTNDEIESFCRLNYGVSFPMFAKINVNGEKTHPLYKYLKEEQKGILGTKIKWNFTKFLVDKQGKVVSRYAPNKAPKELEDIIEELMK